MKYDYKENVSVIEMVNFLDEAGPEGFEVIRSTNKGVTFIYWWDDDFDRVEAKLSDLSPMFSASGMMQKQLINSIRKDADMPPLKMSAPGEFFKAIFQGGTGSRYGYNIGESYLIFCQITDNRISVKCSSERKLDKYTSLPMDYEASSLKQFMSEWLFIEESMQIKTSID